MPGVPLPGSPFTGSLHYAADWDDVYNVALTGGQKIAVSMTTQMNTDFDLYLYGPGTTDVTSDPWLTGSANYGGTEYVEYIGSVRERWTVLR